MTPPRASGAPTHPDTTDGRALLFDMDGVLIEGRGADDVVHERARDDALRAFDVEVPDRHRPALASYEYEDGFVAACRDVGLDPVDFYATRERHSARRIVDRLRAGERGLYPDVDALDGVANGRRLGLVSNNYDPAVEFVVDHHGLDAFSFARGRDADAGYYVGDRETDLLAAERAGLEGVFVRRDHNAETRLRVEPTHEIATLSDLDDLLDR